MYCVQDMWVGFFPKPFMLSSLPCFPAVYCSAVPTSRYTFTIVDELNLTLLPPNSMYNVGITAGMY